MFEINKLIIHINYLSYQLIKGTQRSIFSRFKAANRGTLYWHGHAGLHRADGLFGALIIREPPTLDPSSHLYHHDLPEHVMIVHDWLVELTVNRFSAHHHAGYDNKPASMLINGKFKNIYGQT